MALGLPTDPAYRIATLADFEPIRFGSAPVVSVLKDRWGDTYEGFPVSVVLSPGFRAQRGASASTLG